MKRFWWLGLLILVAGCTGTSRARDFDFWKNRDVTLYGATGTVIGHWISNGRVYNEQHSNGYYFTDLTTGKLILVEGTLVMKDVN